METKQSKAKQSKAKQSKAKQSKGLKRNTIDKYYTKDRVVETCLAAFKTHVKIGKKDLCIEPSAGNGSFIPGIKALFKQYRFYDLEPEHAEIIKQDYLLFNADALIDPSETIGKIHVIGNPPFGRQSSLAIKFIKKSCEFCNSIAFILPKSFKKDSLQKTFPLNFHLILETDLPDKAFLVDDVEHNVPSVFQIWVKSKVERAPVEKLVPMHFTFVNMQAPAADMQAPAADMQAPAANMQAPAADMQAPAADMQAPAANMQAPAADVSFRRVGVNAGTISTEIEEKSEQSHYFIKFTNNKPLTENLTRLAGITYNSNNTVGPRSISKQELIKEFNKVL